MSQKINQAIKEEIESAEKELGWINKHAPKEPRKQILEEKIRNYKKLEELLK
jgi:hypothetical protein